MAKDTSVLTQIIKVIFGSPEKYEYNPTNVEKVELIFVEQPKLK